MQLLSYTSARANKLEKLQIPALSAPVCTKILWMRMLSYQNGKKQISTKAHSHSFFELHFVAEGTITYRTEHELLHTLNAGDAILFAPEHTHTVHTLSENLVKFSLAFLPPEDSFVYAGLAAKPACFFPAADQILHALDAVLAEADLKSTFSLPIIQSRILDMLYALCKGAGVQERAHGRQETADDIRVARVKQYIRDNADTLFTCAEVAKQCHFNVKYLNRIFKAQTGMTLLSYIHREKIKDAEAMLCESTASLEHISRELGFANVYYFSNFFKRCTGFTPGDFRKLGKK